MSLGLAAALFVAFVVNVVIGSTGSTRFLGDVGEMLVLFASACFFVVAILKAEANAKRRHFDKTDQ